MQYVLKMYWNLSLYSSTVKFSILIGQYVLRD